MAIVWAVLLYGITILVFNIAARIAPLPLIPIVWAYKAVTREAFIHPWHPALVFINVVASCILAELTMMLFASMGYGVFWPIPVGLILLNLWSGAKASIAAQGQCYSIVIAMLVFLATLPFRH